VMGVAEVMSNSCVDGAENQGGHKNV